ncbi:MAG: glycerol-3-phosphate 1-O-acyltransferase PlsY [Myxococcota bacterium]
MSPELVLAACGISLGSYLLGSVPFGLLLARGLAGVDVRAGGSGNIGATNVARLAGKGLGLLTLVLDAAKGAAAVLVAGLLVAPAVTGEHAGLDLIQAGWWPAALAGASALVGHCFPIWLRFRGGKGAATALGVLLVVSPWSALAGGLVFALLVLALRISSLGSLAAVIVVVPTAFLTAGAVNGWLVLFMGVLVVARHHENIRRLLSGSERRI